MIKRFKMTRATAFFRGVEAPAPNILCARELQRWVRLPARIKTIWLCVSDKPKSRHYAYRYLMRTGAAAFVTGDKSTDTTRSLPAPLAYCADKFWSDNMPGRGWAWIEYEE